MKTYQMDSAVTFLVQIEEGTGQYEPAWRTIGEFADDGLAYEFYKFYNVETTNPLRIIRRVVVVEDQLFHPIPESIQSNWVAPAGREHGLVME